VIFRLHLSIRKTNRSAPLKMTELCDLDCPLPLPCRSLTWHTHFCYLRFMASAPSFCAVILAAGESSRMGTDKALLPWPPGALGQTFLSAAIESLNDFSDMVIVVAGKNTPNLAPVVYANAAFLVSNPAPERGQFSSLQIGLQEVLNRGRDAAIITLVDRPPLRPSTLQTLCQAFATRPHDKWSIVPEYRGKHGHPFFISREMIHAFSAAPATANAQEIEHQHQNHIEYVAVDDPLVTLNVDTPEDYSALSSFAAPIPKVF
jgi:molybdenum cofactor cytidylyltransferase